MLASVFSSDDCALQYLDLSNNTWTMKALLVFIFVFIFVFILFNWFC